MTIEVAFQGVLLALALDGGDADRSFELKARWEPIAASKYKLHETQSSLAALRAPKPAKPVGSWPFESVQPLLPAAVQAGRAPLDEVFRLRVDSFLPFLRQLHPGAQGTVKHMIDHPGAFGWVLERTDDTLDVLYRVHAGFELEAERAWAALAQFEGRLVVDRRNGAVEHFSLRLPETSPNVDVNVALSKDRIIADIGTIPALGLATEKAARPCDEARLEQGRAALRRAFYEFAAIEWHSLDDGLLRAAAEDKPLHVVVLFGALADESC
jgi:hypothetical protein